MIATLTREADGSPTWYVHAPMHHVEDFEHGFVQSTTRGYQARAYVGNGVVACGTWDAIEDAVQAVILASMKGMQ